MPDLRKSIVTRRHFTPQNFRDELNAFQGSAFSVAPKLTQSAFFRPHNRDSRIPGLYIVARYTSRGRSAWSNQYGEGDDVVSWHRLRSCEPMTASQVSTRDFDVVPGDDSEVIAVHSKSFSAAARLLPREVRRDAELLYVVSVVR